MESDTCDLLFGRLSGARGGARQGPRGASYVTRAVVNRVLTTGRAGIICDVDHAFSPNDPEQMIQRLRRAISRLIELVDGGLGTAEIVRPQRPRGHIQDAR